MALSLLSMFIGCYLQPSESTLIPMDSASDTSSSGTNHGGRPDDGAVEGFQSGILNSDNAKMYWLWYGYEDWPNGNCVEMRLQNTGPAIKNWSAELDLDQSITKWVYNDGAWIFPSGDMLSIGSESSATLESNASVMLYYCAEPRTQPQAIRLTGTLVNPVTPPVDDTGDTNTDTATDTGDTSIFGSVTDSTRTLILQYSSAGYTANGGECVDLVLFNQGTQTLSRIALALSFSGSFDITTLRGYISGVHNGNQLSLSPTYTTTLAPGQSNSGTICMDPLQSPTAMAATFTVATNP